MVVSSYRNQETTDMKYYIEDQAWEAILSFFKKKSYTQQEWGENKTVYC